MKPAWLKSFFWALLLTALAAFSARYSLAATQPPSGVIVEIQGPVVIKNSAGLVVASSEAQTSGSSASRLLKKDAPFYEGETIMTGEGARLKLQFVEGSNEVQLGPNTTLVVQRAPSDPRMKRGTKLFLDAGTVDSKVHQKYSGVDDDEFSIVTKTLVAGVRGTQFEVTHLMDVSTVSVKSGVVEVLSLPGNVSRGKLSAGQRVSSKSWSVETTAVDASKDPQKPAAVNDKKPNLRN